MVRDAEVNAEADAQKKQAIEAKNEIDSLIYSTEKSLNEHKDKLDDEAKKEVEKAIEEAKSVKESDDLDELKAKTEALSQASMKMGQAIYGQQRSGDASEGEDKKDETAVDAEFEEKKKDED